MTTMVVYDGTFDSFLTAVFEVFEHKYADANIVSQAHFQPSLLGQPHIVYSTQEKFERVWKGLQQKLSGQAVKQLYRAFLSEEKGIENVLLLYIQKVFASKATMEDRYADATVLTVVQTAKKVYREKHRMEAFIRFQLTKDGLYYALCQPDFNVLPLIIKHFKDRYADQRWLIYDTRRRYGIYYDLEKVSFVELEFSEAASNNPALIVDEQELAYQALWQQYFKSVNIAARKNTKLHIQHMPRRYWKYLTEKTS